MPQSVAATIYQPLGTVDGWLNDKEVQVGRTGFEFTIGPTF